MKKSFSIKDMNVKTKITVFAFAMLILMIIITVAGLFAANTINTERKELYDNYAMGQYYLSDGFTNFCNAKVHVRNAILIYADDSTKFSQEESKITTSINEMREEFSRFEAIMGDFSPQIQAQYQKLEDAADNWVTVTNETIELGEKGRKTEAVNELTGRVLSIADEAEAELETLITLITDESNEKVEYVEKSLIVLTAILIAVAAIAVIFAIIYAGILIKSITVPVSMLSEAAKKMAIGDVDVDCRRINDDDLGELMDNFNSMVKNIKGQADIANDIAKGDLTVEASVRSDKDVLGKSFQRLIADNNRILGNIKESTNQVTIGAEQVASASQSLAQGSTEQASALQQVTASMAEIAERTKDNAMKATEADNLVHSVKATATEGNRQMEEMISAMNDINESSETISKIIKTIDDIAFQTNILALNAAVEAARAGVHGKGFAVVAEEVRNLAAKSASAASETAGMIEDSIRKVGIGTKIAEETATSLEQIVLSIDKSVELIDNIAEASNDQATAVSQIDQAITQVSTVVQTNSATSEQCAAASEELSNQAANLRELLGEYKLASGRQGGSSRNNNYESENYNETIISLDGEFGKY